MVTMKRIDFRDRAYRDIWRLHQGFECAHCLIEGHPAVASRVLCNREIRKIDYIDVEMNKDLIK